jgi:hypothetical protein
VAGTSEVIAVSPAVANHFVVHAPTSAAAGTPFLFTVTVQDPYSNFIPDYTGTVHFRSSDSGATVPTDTALTGGTGAFSATLYTAGSQTLRARDTANNAVTGVSGNIAVSGAATHFVVSAPSSVKAGSPMVVSVMAEDQFNRLASDYNGTAHFSSSDSQAALPANAILAGGIGFFPAILKTAGSQTLAATDTGASTITGASNTIAVSSASANHFVVTAAPLPSYPGVPAAYPTIPSAATSFANTGAPVIFTVSAKDPFGNLAPTYTGTVAFTTSDTGAGVVLPGASTLTAGAGIFSATLATAGNQFITATDFSGVPAFAGISNAIVNRGLVVTSFAPTPSGFTITFNKPFNASTVLMYTAGTTPDDIILATAGSQVSVRGSVVFNPPTNVGGSPSGFTFIKTDNIAATGTFNPGSGLLAAGNYTVTLRSLVAGNGFQDMLGVPLDGTDTANTGTNYRITFSVSAPPVAVGIPDFARGPSNTDAISFPPLANGATFALIYTNPAATPQTATATITFSSTAATLQTNIQNALTSGGLATQIGVNASANNTPNSVVIVTNDVSSGANVLVTFQSALAQATNQLLSSNTAGVSIALASINVANNVPGNGIPIALSSGLNVTSGSFTLQYNPSLLNITAVVSKVAGASFILVANTINNTTSATAVLSLSSPTRLSSTATAITMGSLLATVPLSATATFGAKQLLHFSSEQLNGTAGPITVTNADAVQVAAYFGDVTDIGGPLSLADASAISAVANAVANTLAQTIPGFAAFPNVDPAIIGDVSLQGNVNSTDAGAITQEVGGNARITIPYAPIGLQVTPAGSAFAVVGNRAAGVIPANIDRMVTSQRPVAAANTVCGSVLAADIPELAQSSVRDLATPPAQQELGQPNLVTKDDLTYLWQTASGTLMAPVPGSFADDAQWAVIEQNEEWFARWIVGEKPAAEGK